MKTTQEVRNEFEQILSDVSRISGITSDSAVQVATAILRESGKFQRTQMLQNRNTGNRNSNQPATDKQKDYMKQLGINFDDSITKAQASDEIEKATAEKKGRVSPASSSHY